MFMVLVKLLLSSSVEIARLLVPGYPNSLHTSDAYSFDHAAGSGKNDCT
jgi:hypothetical protein